MAIEKNDAIPTAYVRGGMPQNNIESMRLFLSDELRKLEIAVHRLATLTPQVADREPAVKYVGMIRYTKSSDWDPLTLGVDAWIYWDGSSWVAM
jgi:hypothetical protein